MPRHASCALRTGSERFGGFVAYLEHGLRELVLHSRLVAQQCAQPNRLAAIGLPSECVRSRQKRQSLSALAGGAAQRSAGGVGQIGHEGHLQERHGEGRVIEHLCGRQHSTRREHTCDPRGSRTLSAGSALALALGHSTEMIFSHASNTAHIDVPYLRQTRTPRARQQLRAGRHEARSKDQG
jgi:hypothetical protein